MDTRHLEALYQGIDSMPCPDTIMNLVVQRIVSAPNHVLDTSVEFRASSIGRPWILQVLDRWYGHKRSFTMGAIMKMMAGKVAQEWVAEIASLASQVYTQETEINYGPVRGHSDFIFLLPDGQRFVVEVKCMASRLCTAFRKVPSDDLGYISQLAFYVHAGNCDGGAFLLLDRDSMKFHWVEITPEVLEAKWARIKLAVDKLTKIPPYDVTELLRVVAIPPTVNGKLPGGVAYSRWVETLYRQMADGWEMRPTEDIAQLLRGLPQRRADRYDWYEQHSLPL